MGATYAGWTIYSHILRKDPLMEALYKIVGGKENFHLLPKYKFDAYSENISQDLKKIKWENLNGPIFRAKTKDGRTILIVKARSQKDDGGTLIPVKSIFIFVEKVGPNDSDPNPKSKTSPTVNRVLESVRHSLAFFTGNTFGETVHPTDFFSNSNPNASIMIISTIEPSINSETANEFFAQLSQGYDGYY